MIAHQPFGAHARLSGRASGHPAPYPYPSTRHATAAAAAAASQQQQQQQRMASHPGFATHSAAAAAAFAQQQQQQQHEYQLRAASAGTIGTAYPVEHLPRLSFDRSTLPAYVNAPMQQWHVQPPPQQQQQDLALDSSPFSELSDDFADAGELGDFGFPAAAVAGAHDEDEPFEDGLVKDQYRGRGWDAGRSLSNASSAAFEPAHVHHLQQQQAYQPQVQQQQQPQQAYQQQPQNGHLDRLFQGLQLPPLVGAGVQQQQFFQAQQQQQQQMLPPLQHAPPSPHVQAPVQPPAPSSALPLSPFVAEVIWSLLQQAPATAPSTLAELKYGVSSFGRMTKQTGAAAGEVQINTAGQQQWDDDRWFPLVPFFSLIPAFVPLSDTPPLLPLFGDAAYDGYSTDSYGHRTPPQFTLDDFALAPAPPAVAANPYRLGSAHPPPGFARFINQTLAQTLISPTGVLLALWYVANRMPLHDGGGEEGVMFRDELLRCARKFEGEAVARRVVTLGLAWANKWLDDNTFTNRSWSDVTHIPIEEINRLELHALATMSFDLTISNAEWASWLSLVYAAPAASPVVQAHLVELADALAGADAAHQFAAAETERRIQAAKDERERRRREVAHERALAAQWRQQQQQRQAQAAAAAAASALYYPTSCARYSAAPAHIHQHGALMPAACW